MLWPRVRGRATAAWSSGDSSSGCADVDAVLSWLAAGWRRVRVGDGGSDRNGPASPAPSAMAEARSRSGGVVAWGRNGLRLARTSSDCEAVVVQVRLPVPGYARQRTTARQGPGRTPLARVYHSVLPPALKLTGQVPSRCGAVWTGLASPSSGADTPRIIAVQRTRT